MNTTIKMHSNSRMSQVVIHNGTIYLSGKTARNEGDIHQQTMEILQSIDNLLAEAQSSKSHLLSAQIWLKNMHDFDAMNEIWEAWLKDVIPPVRACTQSAFAKPHYLIEIQVVAAKV
ncbi:hypothetical protein HA49_04465 [Tatumella morbirosei]|uniref:Uncharacterized protein n=2 Tax=Tatumella morbirosei TaxID=642227 RepID=A0A095TJK4_9GAMM|nr:hypothetical protein HA49_04465 [Tatumella morbirosei]